MELEKLRALLNSEMGQPLKRYLAQELNKLKNIENIEKCTSPTQQAVEYTAQLKAYRKVAEILENIVSITADDIDEEENEYAV